LAFKYGFKLVLNQTPVYYVSILYLLSSIKAKIMTNHIKPFLLLNLFIALSTGLIAQDAPQGTAAPASDQPAKKSCRMSDYCAKMKQAPKKGFHHSIEWGGIYGGPRNQVTYRMFGHTFNQDMRDRDAIRMNAGYQFNPYLYVGGGVGAEFQYQSFTNRMTLDVLPAAQPEYSTTNYTGSLVLVPIYAEVKGYLLKKSISPLLQMRMGYAPVIYVGEGQRTVEHSYYENISVGVRIYSHLSITAGYLFMYQPTSVSGYDETQHNSIILDKSNPYQHRFTVGIAIGM
jgi:hypothetical protein